MSGHDAFGPRDLDERWRRLQEESNGHVEWTPPEVLEAYQFCARDWPSEPELLGPLIRARQRTLLAGATGEGKSILALWMIEALAHGSAFLAWDAAPGPPSVLWIDLELSENQIAQRLETLELDDPAAGLQVVSAIDGLALVPESALAEAQREWLHAQVSERRPDIVVVDPFYKMHVGDAGDERAMVDLMRLFDGWRKEMGFALVMLTHLRKASRDRAGNETTPTINDVFGSAGISWGADVVLGVQRVHEGFSRLHFWKDRSGALPVGSFWNLSYERERGYRVAQLPSAVADASTGNLIQALLDVGEGMTATKEMLVKASGLGQRTVERHLRELEDHPAYELLITRGSGRLKLYSLRPRSSSED